MYLSNVGDWCPTLGVLAELGQGCDFTFEYSVFQHFYGTRDNGELLAIGVRIKAKSDESYKYLTIWPNDKVPELCLLRQILI
jgi:hypothetical protein